MDLITANPGNTIILDCAEDNRFQRLFVCYPTSVNGLGDCRPVLGLDGAYLKAKYLCILLGATGVDANGALFTLAYAVVDAENVTIGFGSTLCFVKLSMNMRLGISLVRRSFLTAKKVLESIERAFPGSPHSYCIRHLYDNLHKHFKHPALRACLYRAA